MTKGLVTMVDNLQQLRAAVTRGLIMACWAFVPLVASVAWLLGHGLAIAGVTLAVAAVATYLTRRAPSAPSSRITLAVSTVAIISLLLAATQGAPWQVDIHMAYFAALAVLSLYADMAVIVVATVVIALHHTILNFVLPGLVFPNGG